MQSFFQAMKFSTGASNDSRPLLGSAVCLGIALLATQFTYAFAKTDESGKNLIRNSDFARINGDKPVAWSSNVWGGEAEFAIDREIGHSSSPSVRITSASGADASWSIRVDVRPNTRYRFSAWVKTLNLENLSGRGAQLNAHELQMQGRSDALDGTNDWTQIVTELETGEQSSLLLNLLFGGWGFSRGTVWFDDVELVEIGSNIPTMSEAEAIRFYETRIKPVIVDNCAACHGDDPEDLSGGLAITSRASLLRGGESGPAVDPRSPEKSLLLAAVNYEAYQMPPDGKLPQENIDDIKLWLQLGMPWTPGEEVDPGPVEKKSLVDDKARQWWAFQPVRQTESPAVRNTDWARTEIDRFVLGRLESEGLTPAPEADRLTLVRRAYFDLLGLPPTAEQVEAFMSDSSPDAWEKLIDRLLDSPHYGEKWGRHWLDLVRYAESNSFERDGTKPYVWRYRDYVIRAFNEDKPYDRFLIEQLAGDELAEVTVESMTATGYYRLGQWDDEPADPVQARYDDLDDILATTSQTMLGLTVNCARCHDHKIDPVSQRDYYSMLAAFGNIRRYGVRAHETVLDASVTTMSVDGDQVRIISDAEERDRRRLEGIEAKMARIEGKVKADFAPVEHEDFQYEQRRLELVGKRAGSVITQEEFDEYRQLTERRNELRAGSSKDVVRLLTVKESGAELPTMYVNIRGNAHVQGVEVTPAIPEVLGARELEFESPESATSTGARKALAEWIASPENPLTARVMVNRIWQYHFGEGIVRSTSDYGYQGTPPTHPELLDWLAARFVSDGWSIKSMHREIMRSSTYRMSGEFDQRAYDRDPENELLWRFSMRRLTSEEVRDSILMATGQLNLKDMYGPSVYPTMPQEILQGQSMPGDGWRQSSPDQANRRSVYVHVKRSMQLPLLSVHDMADTDATCPVRFVTTQPTQALTMMNSDFSGEAAAEMARLVTQTCPDDPAAQIAMAFRRVTQRVPNDDEAKRLNDLLVDWQANDGLGENDAMRQMCLLLLNLNEFIYVD